MEYFNHTLLSMLPTLPQSYKTNWKAHLNKVVHAYNCTRHESTGYSPFYLLFGQHLQLPVDLIDSGGKLSTRLYDKRDDFDFHIVNFPYLSSNIPSGPSYGVYISQLIRYARCCSDYDDFRYRHKCLVDRLLSQGYIALRVEKSFKKFYGRYQDLIEKYQRSVNVMVNDSFPG